MRSDLTANTANQFNRTAHTVGILWLGYDAPQSILPEAMDVSYAQDARDDLSRFQDGLRVTHEGPASHNTIIGHSYGSTVVGVTAHDRGTHADDVVFVGSPGVGVDHASDLGLGSDHVWSTHLSNDPISGAHNVRTTVVQSALDVPRFGPFAPAAAAWDFAHGGDHLLYGTNPDAPAFGGQHFTGQDGSFGLHAHSEYWDANSTSLKNMGYVVAGQPNEVELVKP
jgi:pimeloyl-ACP methyl ester carboxylesterase